MFSLQTLPLPSWGPLAVAQALSATSRMGYFSLLDSWFGVGGPEQVPYLPAEQLLLETAGHSTIWLLMFGTRWFRPRPCLLPHGSLPAGLASHPTHLQPKSQYTGLAPRLCLPHSHLLFWTQRPSDPNKIPVCYEEEKKKRRMLI